VIAAAVAAIGLHSLFYNALFEDPMFWGCARADRPLRALPPTPAGGRDVAAGAVRCEAESDGVIEAWKRVLVLAPHTDDGEFGCGGTMARLVDLGADVLRGVLDRDEVLPEGFAGHALAGGAGGDRRARDPGGELTVHDFEVRTFPSGGRTSSSS
jgi:hypothetical protein